MWKWVAGLMLTASVAYGQSDSTYKPLVQNIRTVPGDSLSDNLPMVAQYKMPTVYLKWAKEIANCEGLLPLPDTLIKSIVYFEVNATDFQINDKDAPFPFLAVSVVVDGVMYVSVPHLLDKSVIEHEFLHFLLRLYGIVQGNKDTHPVRYFGKCGVGQN